MGANPVSRSGARKINNEYIQLSCGLRDDRMFGS